MIASPDSVDPPAAPGVPPAAESLDSAGVPPAAEAPDSAGVAPAAEAPDPAGVAPAAERPYSAAEVDAAVDALRRPERLAQAQEVVTHAAPSLHRVLSQALEAGGWFGSAHDSELLRTTSIEDEQERLEAVHALVADETQLGMMVGVAVGFELAHELRSARERVAVGQDQASAEGPHSLRPTPSS